MSKPGDLNILACQADVPPMTTAAQRDRHLQHLSGRVRAALDRAEGAIDIVVLPELSAIEYSRESFDCLADLAEPLDGSSFECWSALAVGYGIHVVFGFARAGSDGNYITTAVVGPDGKLIGHYDKIHLAQFGASMEKEYFIAGDHLLVFEVKGIKLAPIICYDIRIPEQCRTLVIDQGVDVILHCGAYFRDDSFNTWHQFAIARALENQVYFLSLNRAGANYGNSLFCDPWHDQNHPPMVFDQESEDIRHLVIKPDLIEATRRDYTFLGDRLDSYRALDVTGTQTPTQ